jgi:hypothetical protein
MVTPTVMAAAVLPAEIVSVLVPELLIGLSDAVRPVGKLRGEKLTLLVLKPFDGVTVIVLMPLAPCTRVRLLGDADRLKFGGRGAALTVRATVVV